jgi:hypothetical protein
MRDIAHDEPFIPASVPLPRRLAVWNMRLLIAATVFILWSASVLALHAAGPKAQALLAGEGMLISGQLVDGD